MEAGWRSLGALLLAALLALGAGSCGGDDDNAETVVETVTETTSESIDDVTAAPSADLVGNYSAALKVLSAVIDRSIEETDYAVAGFRTDPNLTAALISKVEELQLPGGGIDFQPFLCAQNTPRSVHYEPARDAGDEMTINGIYDFGAGKPVAVTYEMVIEGGAWKLNSDECIEQALAAG